MFNRAASFTDISSKMIEKIRVCNATYTVRFGGSLALFEMILSWSFSHNLTLSRLYWVTAFTVKHISEVISAKYSLARSIRLLRGQKV